jgi:hypothetical protein
MYYLHEMHKWTHDVEVFLQYVCLISKNWMQFENIFL